MRFQVERDALADAVAWVSRALPGRPVIPVLSGLLLTAADGLTLSCFDYEVSARVQVDAKVVEPGVVLVPGRLLAEITRSLPSLPVEFADDPEGVSLTCGSASFTLVTLPVEDYPDLPGLPQAAGTVDGGALAAAIGQVAPAASRDDTLPLLTGVNIEVNGKTMTLAATDRYRLAVRDLRWNPVRPGITGAFLVPARTLADAAKTMSAGTPVTIKLRSDGGLGGTSGDGEDEAGGDRGRGAARPDGAAGAGEPAGAGAADAMIGFETGGRRLTTRLIAGEFIRYRSRFPSDFGCRADMPAGQFAEAVRRVSLVAERGSPVRLSFGGGEVTIEAGTQGRARAREMVPADFEGAEPVIAFNPHYLLDGITAAAITTAAPDADGSASVPHGGSPHREDPSSPAGADPAGITDVERGDRGTASHSPVACIRLEFTSATKPAVITGIHADQPAGAGSAAPGGDGPAVPDFRYLVVPLRAPAPQ
ncbi:MAG TPA: DNA polymerase III subunit beta [Streptosporangiaceae bacterium]|jgi:DNA polymerase-3 subunit beta|nr:DNA polymerase III subunit beta [Streptosporangiaceae bacterium]